ncbi:DUF3721 domain-containing protein [Cyanobium sp. Morenito 9A2]|uniref:DUF3721 domain-containing protein n=1 Tax=Cyanobium sp. Morenito 9A2 TaxID=2823718 RepID=UPI0020CDA524|nr:DUF3721 domain-containing protein [Cyanobium sp. Morenito 9A2]MCP9849241.1 DUF3721 domain-containing protein [Cyanobium sp. Morenito 9A2]
MLSPKLPRFWNLSVAALVLLGANGARAQANDMFPTKIGAETRAKELKCSGTFAMGREWMPCASFEAYQKAVSKEK